MNVLFFPVFRRIFCSFLPLLLKKKFWNKFATRQRLCPFSAIVEINSGERFKSKGKMSFSGRLLVGHMGDFMVAWSLEVFIL